MMKINGRKMFVLFQDELNSWVSRIKTAAGEDKGASPSGYATLPPNLEGKREEPKRRSFMTLGKKKYVVSVS